MKAGELARLEAIIDASGAAERIEMLLPVGVRPRQLSVRSLLLGILLTLQDKRPAHLARFHEALIDLPDDQKRRLGVTVQWRDGEHLLTYRQLERTYGLIVAALAKEKPDGRPSEILSEAMDGLVQASVKVLGEPESSSLAIDWTDYESFARPPRKKDKDAEQQEQQDLASDSGADHGQAQAESQQEQDSQKACADPEAAWGHRKVNHPGKAEMFFGYYLQAATIVKEERGPEVPELVARITLASCKHDPPAMVTPVIARMMKSGVQIGDLTVDSGYSYREPQTFAMPARATGANLVMDLHPNDRGMKGSHQGAIAANGNLYCPATPKALFELRPARPGATDTELAANDKKTTELARYKLSPLTATDQDGYHRVACPAVRGKLRCPLRPASLSLSHEHPSISEPPEHPPPCCKQQTITVPASVNAKTKQKHDWPSAAHRESYARRTASERSFSQVCDPASNDIKRGWSRLMGLTPNALMLTCLFIVANIRTADAFAARQAEDQARRKRGLPPRKRAKRRRSIHDLTSHSTEPPALAA